MDGTSFTTVPDVRLFSLDGELVPTTLMPDPVAAGHFLVRPNTALSPGTTYRLIDFGRCGATGGREGAAWPAFNNPFSVVAKTPSPTTIGTVRPLASQRMPVEIYHGAACSEVVPAAAVALIAFDLSAEADGWRVLRGAGHMHGKDSAMSAGRKPYVASSGVAQ